MGKKFTKNAELELFFKDGNENSSLVPFTLDLLLSSIQRRGQSGTGIAIHRMKKKNISSLLSIGRNPLKSIPFLEEMILKKGVGYLILIGE